MEYNTKELDDKYAEKMQKAIDIKDCEITHDAMDEYLEELLLELGMFRTLKLYRDTEKFYS